MREEEEEENSAGETELMEAEGSELAGETEAMAEENGEDSQKTAVLSADEEESEKRGFSRFLEKSNFSRLDEASSAIELRGSGCRKKSFTEVRAASLRASGLSASRHATPDIGVSLRNSSCADEGSLADEGTSKNVSHAARKLTFEEEASDKAIFADDRNSDLLYSLYCSQEPAEQLKENALKAVDEFLFVNDLGLTQDFNKGNEIEVEKSSVPSAAGAHKLLKTCIPGSPVGKARIFDWVDSFEDEGGGDFFAKRKDILFGATVDLKKAHASLKKESRLYGAHSKRPHLSSSEPRRWRRASMSKTLQNSPVKLSEASLGKLNMEEDPRTTELLSSNLGGSVRRSMRLKTVQKSSKGDSLSVFGPRIACSVENQRVNYEQVKSLASVSLACANEDNKCLGRDGQNEGAQPVDVSALPTCGLNSASPSFSNAHSLSGKCRRRSSRSSVIKELMKLGKIEVSPDVGLKDLRRRRGIASIRVCLSHHLDDDVIKQQKRILARLGISSVDDVSEATHFVADKFVRTRNMLLAMALGKPVVSHHWLECCSQACCVIDEKNYILRDVKKEKEIGFNMLNSLSRSRQKSLLQGKRVFITPNVKPSRDLVVDLVRAAKGHPLERVGRSAEKQDILVISCEEDFTIALPFLERGGEVFSSELLLNGIIVQRLDYERHQMFCDRVKRTRSTVWIRASSNSRFLSSSKSR